MFGRELIKKEKLRTFIRSYPTVPASASLEDVLGASVKHLDADGLIVVKNDRYAGVIFKSSLLAMYDANRTLDAQTIGPGAKNGGHRNARRRNCP